MGEKGSPDFVNEFARYHEELYTRLDKLGSLMSEFISVSQKHIGKEWRNAQVNGNDVVLNMSVMSMYVDNSNGGHAITISPVGGQGSWQVGANSQGWVHPLGGNQFTIQDSTGSTRTIPVMFVNQFISLK